MGINGRKINFLYFFLLGFTIVAYQNCGSSGDANLASSDNSFQTPVEGCDPQTGEDCSEFIISPNSPCSFNGVTVDHGDSITTYGKFEVSQGTCSQEERVCNHGNLSGGLVNLSCNPPVLGQRSCTLNTSVIPHGGSITAYQQVPQGNTYSCSSQQRVCNDGILSGSEDFSLISCAPTDKQACVLGDVTANHGESIKTFRYSSVTGSQSDCDSLSRISVCNDGDFQLNPYKNFSCDSQPLSLPPTGNDCTHMGLDIEHGRGRWFFRNANRNYTNLGEGCHADSNAIYLRCEDGSMFPTRYDLRTNPPNLNNFDQNSCNETGRSCQLAGQTINHNGSIYAHINNSVPYSQGGCSANGNRLTGYCIDGQLMEQDRTTPATVNGHTLQSCTETGTDCQLDGIDYNHNAAIPSRYRVGNLNFIEATPSGFDRTCVLNNNSAVLKCLNGQVMRNKSLEAGPPYELFNRAEYPYATCTVNASNCNFRGVTYNHTERLPKFFRQDVIQTTDPNLSCDDNDNSIEMICIDGVLKNWSNTSSTVVNGILVTADPATNADPSQHMETSCRIDLQ